MAVKRRDILDVTALLVWGEVVDHNRLRGMNDLRAQVAPGGGWPVSGHDAANTGYNADSAVPADSGDPAWVRENTAEENRPVGPPLVADGLLVQAGEAVVARDATTGDEQWRWESSGDDLTYAAIADGRVFVADASGHLLALDAASGDQQWAVDVTRIYTEPVYADGTVYLPSDYGVRAFDAATGEPRWHAQSSATTRCAVADGTVYVVNASENLQRIDAETGEIRWEYDVGRMAAPTVADGMVYLGGEFNESPTTVRAVESRREVVEDRWAFDAGAPVNEPAVAGDVVVVTTADGTVYGIDAAEGDQRWEYDADGQIGDAGGTPPRKTAVAGDVVLVVVDRETVHAVSLDDGTEVWTHSIRTTQGPFVTVADETVYAGGWGGVTAIGGGGLPGWVMALVGVVGAVGAVLLGVVGVVVALLYRRRTDEDE